MAEDVEAARSLSEKLPNWESRVEVPLGLSGGRRFALSCTGISMVSVPSGWRAFFKRFTSAPSGNPISRLNSPILSIEVF